MNVFVAGGAGYIGSVLVRQLLACGHTVRIYDNLIFGPRGLTEVQAQIDLRVGDVRDVSERDLDGIDAVINLAGISSDPTAEFRPALTHQMNVVAAVRLAEVCKKTGARRYLFASSCSVYDSGVVSESTDVLFDETSSVKPTSAYAKSKREAEERLLALADGTFQPVFLRMGTVYGFSPRMRYDLVINTLLKDALSRGVMTLRAGGETWRPVVEASDAARAYVACLEANESLVAGQAFNVVYRNLRVSEMALRIRHALGQLGVRADIETNYRECPVRSYRVSGAKLAEVLGFQPSVSVEQAVNAMLAARSQDQGDSLDHPRYYNIRWFEWLERIHKKASVS